MNSKVIKIDNEFKVDIELSEDEILALLDMYLKKEYIEPSQMEKFLYSQLVDLAMEIEFNRWL